MLLWEFDKKIGQATITRNGEEMPVYLYQGNAFLIMLFEWHNDEMNTDRYNLYNFFADEEHCKRCFGLAKGYNSENIFAEDNEITSIELWTDKVSPSYVKKFAPLFVQGMPTVTITLTHSPDTIDFPHWNA